MNSWQMFLKSFEPVQVCDITMYKWLLLGRQIEPLTIAECASVPISAGLAPVVLLPAGGTLNPALRRTKRNPRFD